MFILIPLWWRGWCREYFNSGARLLVTEANGGAAAAQGWSRTTCDPQLPLLPMSALFALRLFKCLARLTFCKYWQYMNPFAKNSSALFCSDCSNVSFISAYSNICILGLVPISTFCNNKKTKYFVKVEILLVNGFFLFVSTGPL